MTNVQTGRGWFGVGLQTDMTTGIKVRTFALPLHVKAKVSVTISIKAIMINQHSSFSE